MTTLRITEQSSRVEIAEALTHLAHRAAREARVIGTADLPTPWDVRHGAIDELLYQLEGTSA